MFNNQNRSETRHDNQILFKKNIYYQVSQRLDMIIKLDLRK